MSFQTGLSGLNASSRNLDVIGNNIANANTIGMKSSRVEYADIVASSLGTAGGGGGGIGVSVATVSQQFSQGSINITGNDLDVAINGGGFFQLTLPDGSSSYTRDGQFKLDKSGNIITNAGAKVLGYKIDATGNPIVGAKPTPLQLPTAAPIAASATTSITAEFNLDARANLAAGVPAVPFSAGPPIVAAVAAIPATPRTTYGTSLTTFDSQGATVPVSLYFERVASTTTDNWDVFDSASGGTALFQMQFDANGTLTSPLPGAAALTLNIATPSAVTPNISATLDISKVTQYGSAFAVSNLAQDGYASGDLVGVKIGENGVITASYSNGQKQAAGQVALADFRNVQGLVPTGGGTWAATSASGDAVDGSPGLGKFGSLRSGALEESNVDLTAELVNMMTAQRAYQANAQTIKTQDQAMTTLVNLR
ncbi:flagellar hook protein FlgE [Rhodoferax ferrireducens]|uniref:flagellar hook protein FlgE n=1 Tax=Rhodoferax ferrireducens TaxID=192843 RepID=UPI000E0D7F2E|nr:flagellar hook protein FlgE [Rhodoferax ferrireducens]